MRYAELTHQLSLLADPTLEAYQKKVVTDTNYPMGYIRMDVLRKLAKKLSHSDWQQLIIQARWETFEEVLVIGLAAAYADVPLADKLNALRCILPKLDSWAMTDAIVPTLWFENTQRKIVWDFAMECIDSEREYTVRFGIVLLLRFFLTQMDVSRVAARLIAIRDDRYYVKMAVAWCFAEMAVSHYDIVNNVLKSNALDPITQNKTIQKIRESYRISEQHKAEIMLLRRK